MIDIQVAAIILLILRATSAIFIGWVIAIQYRLLKLPIDRELRTFRHVLFMLSIVVFVGNFIPAFTDALSIFIELPRARALAPLSMAYAASNALTSVASALLIWLLYKIAGDSNK